MAYGLVANAAERPDHTALVCGERRLTYGELARLVNRTAHALAARGVGAGGRVALMLPNCIEFFTVTNAAATLGALAVPINYRWRRDELDVLGDAAPDALVIDAAFLSECEPALAGAGRPPRDRCSSAATPRLGRRSTTPSRARPRRPAGRGVAERLQHRHLHVGHDRPAEGRCIRRSTRRSASRRRRASPRCGASADDVHLMVGPAYHTMPSAYVAQHLFVGATAVLMTKFDAETCLRLIATERVTTTAMVPAHFVRPRAAGVGARAATTWPPPRLHAAAPCPPDVKRRIMEVFPPDSVWGVLGATGRTGHDHPPDEWLKKPGSVGRPWPGVTVKILDDEGNDCAPNAVGTIYLSTRGAPFRYHNAEEKTAPRSAAASSPSATWATSTTTAISSSPTASTT